MAQKLYEYAVLFHPRPTKKDRDEGAETSSTLITAPTAILAKDEKVAALVAARSIPDKYSQKLDQVEIIIRPF